MRIVQFVEWTEPGEKDKFLNLVKNTKNIDELKEALMQEFKIDKFTANAVIIRFREKINQIQS